MVARLHAIALSQHCQYKIEAGENGRGGRVKYSAIDLAIQVDGENVKLFTRYDFRAFLDF